VVQEAVMNANVAQSRVPDTRDPQPRGRHAARAPWILAALSPVAFVVLMETFEVISMTGALPEFPDALGLPIYFALVAALPVAAIVLGVRAIRRGDRGLPWIPTALGVLMALGLVVMIVGAIVVG
jgi:hypothetical protein